MFKNTNDQESESRGTFDLRECDSIAWQSFMMQHETFSKALPVQQMFP